jgi:hypothetical protein
MPPSVHSCAGPTAHSRLLVDFHHGAGQARLVSRCSVGRSLLRLPGLLCVLVVALFRTAFSPSTAGEVVAHEGIARLEVALPGLADRPSLEARRQRERSGRGG